MTHKRSFFYILNNKKAIPVDNVLEWGEFFRGKERFVAFDTIDGIDISTVFLGIDHAHFGGPPLLFETMIFGGKFDNYQERCETWEQAEAMHARAIEKVIDDSEK